MEKGACTMTTSMRVCLELRKLFRILQQMPKSSRFPDLVTRERSCFTTITPPTWRSMTSSSNNGGASRLTGWTRPRSRSTSTTGHRQYEGSGRQEVPCAQEEEEGRQEV